MKTITEDLLAQGLSHFDESFDKLLVAVNRRATGGDADERVDRQTRHLPAQMENAVQELVLEWSRRQGAPAVGTRPLAMDRRR